MRECSRPAASFLSKAAIDKNQNVTEFSISYRIELIIKPLSTTWPHRSEGQMTKGSGVHFIGFPERPGR